MIWDTSIWRLACWNRWKIPLAQKCYLLGCTPQVRQLEIVTLAARLNLLFKSTLSFENHPELVKHKRALLESNPPRNNQLATHQGHESGSGSG